MIDTIFAKYGKSFQSLQGLKQSSDITHNKKNNSSLILFSYGDKKHPKQPADMCSRAWRGLHNVTDSVPNNLSSWFPPHGPRELVKSQVNYIAANWKEGGLKEQGSKEHKPVDQ